MTILPNSLPLFTRIARRIDPQATLLRAWPLTGGISAQMTALEVQRSDGSIQKLIVRLPSEWKFSHNPQAAADEFKLLQILHTAGLATQKSFDLDQSCEIFPTPYLVMEYVEGQTELAPMDVMGCAHQMAQQLAVIHRVKSAALDLSFLPKQTGDIGEPHADMNTAEVDIRTVLESMGPPLPVNQPALLHGDFWPGNILWRDGKLVAVIDWEDAMLGDPLEDLAISRLDSLFVFNPQFMEAFTRDYQAANPLDFTNLPYWDLRAALRAAPYLGNWAASYPPQGRPDITEQTMRDAHAWFVEQAQRSWHSTG